MHVILLFVILLGLQQIILRRQSIMILTALAGAVTDVHLSASGRSRTHTVEILDFNGTEYDYLYLLYDRVPTLPQSLQKDFGIFRHLWQNIAHRVARTRM